MILFVEDVISKNVSLGAIEYVPGCLSTPYAANALGMPASPLNLVASGDCTRPRLWRVAPGEALLEVLASYCLSHNGRARLLDDG